VIEIHIDGRPSQAKPRIGFELPHATLVGTPLPYTDSNLSLLAKAQPNHVRVELHLGDVAWPEVLASATIIAKRLDAAIEFALFLPEQGDGEQKVCALAEAVRSLGGEPKIECILVHRDGAWWWDQSLIELASRHLQTFAPIYAGTQANFAELNRHRPPPTMLDGICFSMQPQEHAFDDESLAETCQAIGEVMRTAHSFGGNRPIAVSPITLRKRVNPYATGKAAPTPDRTLPASVDPRQMTRFGAAWTLGSLKGLAEAATHHATYYEAVGWRGWMERPEGSPLPDLFCSEPGVPFPLYHVLADALQPTWDRVVPTTVSDPLKVTALLLSGNDDWGLLTANFTNRSQPITLSLGGLTPSTCRTMVIHPADQRNGFGRIGFEERSLLPDRSPIASSILPPCGYVLFRGQSVPGNAVPGNAVPGNAVPGNAVPGNAVPGNAVPGSLVQGNPVAGNEA
jgi:hypothetical protein